MAEREIVTLGDERLRQPSRKMEALTSELETLVEEMIETMRASDGVGLAAVQVGEMVRLILVQTPENEEEPGSGELYVVFNPEILESGPEVEASIEGCLSIPGYIGEVERATQVVVRGQDREGKRFLLRAKGFLARAFQHEIDHTNGVLYIDRLTGPDRIWPVEEGEEEQAEAAQEVPASSEVHI